MDAVDLIKEGEDFLAHHGVLGMHWGQHQFAKAAALGLYGNKKAYSDPEAIKKRTKAGKLRVAAVITGVGGIVISKLSKASNNEYIHEGGRIIGGLATTVGGGLATGAYVNGLQGVAKENAARGIGK